MASAATMPEAPPERDEMQEGGGAAGLVGESSPSPMPDLQSQSRGVVSQVKGIHTNIDELARQFPSGSKDFRKAQDALKDAMVKILSEMQQAGGPKPTPLG